ncbi:MAG TPA: FCD domain-containing protein [Pseudonocardiaceae bacterium]|jgi:GntR family transcriptional repressor for pyruvate dehydrogenase complex
MDNTTMGRAGTSQDGLWKLPDTRRPLPEVIEQKLRELIAGGALHAGQQLPNEPELARRMGVARSSVRTALQRLEVARLVEVRRGRGWFVRKPPADPQDTFLGQFSRHRPDIGEILEVRMALEGMAASLAAARASNGEIDDIAKLCSAHIHAPASDIDRLIDTDERFHEAVVRASGNELLLANYLMLVPELVEFRRASFSERGMPARSGIEHDTVVTFLKRRDSAGARTAMMSHLLKLYHAVQADSDAVEQPANVQLSTLVDTEDEPDWPPRDGNRRGRS